MVASTEYDRPFWVVDETGKFLAGRDDREQADARAAQANSDARRLGIHAEYRVMEKKGA